MSTVGTSSFFRGVEDKVERLPLGLNKSDTKKTCGEHRENTPLTSEHRKGAKCLKCNQITLRM